MSDLPSHPPGGGSGPPARRLGNHELEAVIRRAVELQGARGDAESAEGVTEGEVVRIGEELGLDPVLVRRAISEVRSRPPEERGMLAGVMGPAAARASRTIRRPAAATGMLLEEYLTRAEYMVVQRRFSDRTRYVRGTGVGAAMGRMARSFSSRHPALELKELDVGVFAVDDSTCVVELSVDLGSPRGWLAGVGAGTGGSAAATVAAFALATPAPDLLALVGLPALALTLWGSRAAYRGHYRTMHERLEAFLDRLEHGEVKVPPRQEWGGGAAKFWKI